MPQLYQRSFGEREKEWEFFFKGERRGVTQFSDGLTYGRAVEVGNNRKER